MDEAQAEGADGDRHASGARAVHRHPGRNAPGGGTLCDVPIDTLGSEAVIAAADSPKRREPPPTDPLPYVAKTPPSRCHLLPLLRPSAACPLPIGCQGAAELLPAAAESCQRGQRLTQ